MHCLCYIFMPIVVRASLMLLIIANCVHMDTILAYFYTKYHLICTRKSLFWNLGGHDRVFVSMVAAPL